MVRVPVWARAPGLWLALLVERPWAVSAALRARQRPVPATAAAGHRPARPILGRNSSPTPSRISPKRRQAASVRRQRRNVHQVVRGQALGVCSVQTDPAGKLPHSLVSAGAQAMSHRPTVRASQRKRLLPPADLPDSMARRAAALLAAPLAVAVVLTRAMVAVSAVVSKVAASPARAFPVAVVLPGAVAVASAVVSRAAVSPAKVFPVAAALLAASPAVQPTALALAAVSPRRAAVHRKALSPAAQPRAAGLAALERSPYLVVAALSAASPAVHSPKILKTRKYLNPAQQEWGLAAPSGPRLLNPGPAGTRLRHQLRPHRGHRVPDRHSRNAAGFPGRTGPR